MSPTHPLSAADALSRLYLSQSPALVAQTRRVSAGAYRLRLDAVDVVPAQPEPPRPGLGPVALLTGCVAIAGDCSCDLCAVHDRAAARVRGELARELHLAGVAKTACLAVERGTLDAATLAAVVTDVERAVPRPTAHDATQTLLVRMVRAIADGCHGVVGDALAAWERAECSRCGVAAFDGDGAPARCALCREARS